MSRGNYWTKKQENDRISRENMILFSKLKEPRCHLKKKDLDGHYEEHKKFLQKMSKEK